MTETHFGDYNNFLKGAQAQNVKKAQFFGDAVQQIEPGNCFRMMITPEAKNTGDVQKVQYIYVREISKYGITCTILELEQTMESDKSLSPNKITIYKRFYNSFVEALYKDYPISDCTIEDMKAVVNEMGLYEINQLPGNKADDIELTVFTGNNKEVSKNFVLREKTHKEPNEEPTEP